MDKNLGKSIMTVAGIIIFADVALNLVGFDEFRWADLGIIVASLWLGFVGYVIYKKA